MQVSLAPSLAVPKQPLLLGSQAAVAAACGVRTRPRPSGRSLGVTVRMMSASAQLPDARSTRLSGRLATIERGEHWPAGPRPQGP